MGTTRRPFLPPDVQPWALARPRLLTAIEASSCPLVVLRAGAGYGKTVLAAQWALGRLGTLWCDLGRLKKPYEGLLGLEATNLIIDRYRPGDAELDGMLETLIDDLPQGSRLLILCRAEPSFHLARRRFEGAVLELGADELAFSEEEVNELCERLLLSPNASRLEEIMSRTQGWPIMVRLCCRSLKEVGTLTLRSNGLLAGYLEAEVWSDLAAEQQHFLLGTAALEELRPDWCAELTGVEKSSLRELGDLGVPILPPRQLGQGYRYHPLLRDFLLDKLEEQPTRRKALERQTALLLMDKKRALEATEHALAAEDWELAISCLRKSADRAFREGKAELLRRALSRFPAHYGERSELLRVEGYLAWAAGDLQVALAKARQAAETSDADLRADALILEASAYYAQGDFASERAALVAAIDLKPSDPHVLGKAWFTLGSLNFRAGKLSDADTALRRAAQCTHEGDAVYVAVLSLLPLLPLAKGKPLAATQGLGRAVKANHDFGNQRGEAHAHYHLAIALNQAGMHERALEALREARRLSDRLGLAHLAALIAREKADTLRDLDASDSLGCYRQALTALEAIGAASGLLHAHHGLAVCYRRKGDRDAARRAAERAIGYAEAGDASFVALVRTHLALLQQNAPDANKHLDDVLACPQRYYQALALLYTAAADKRRAARLTREALAIIQDEGFEHLLQTEKSLALPLLELARDHPHVSLPKSMSASPRRFELQLLGELSVTDSSGAHIALRPQALELLALLALRRGATVHPLQIIEILWPGHGEERQPTLQTLVWLLRRNLSKDLIATRATGYAFDPEQQVGVDVEAFGEQLREGQLDRAIELYRGELLPGIAWADLERRHLENQYLIALETLAGRCLEEGRLEQGAALLERVIAVDPLAEEAIEKLIACHQAAGRDAAARRLRREFHRNLELILGA